MQPPKASSLSELLVWGAQELREHSPSARLDSEILLAHLLDCDRLKLVTESKSSVTKEIAKKFAALIARRKEHEPVAYLIGQREFWGLNFEVDSNVLIPRPETELIIEHAVKWIANRQSVRILDLGTGSGCIAIASAHEARVTGCSASIVAIDTSAEALKIAERNAKNIGVRDLIEFRLGHWFAPIEKGKEQFDLVLSNPPYIAPDDPARSRSTDYEPAAALFSGAIGGDGLDAVREIVQFLPEYLTQSGLFLCEIGAMQGSAALTVVPPGFSGEIIKDLAGRDRVLRMSRSAA